ncbi:hypothetical protein Tco_0721395 [Tanacetum coccineum]
MNENENLFVPASMRYDQEMVSKTKEWDERLNPNSKLPNFNTGRIIVLESQVVNESFKPTKNTLESSKDSKAESLTLLPPLKNLHGASPSSEVMPLTFQPHSLRERPGLGIMKHKPETQDSLDKSVSGTVTVSETEPTTPSVPTEVNNIEQESKINELTKLVQMTQSCHSYQRRSAIHVEVLYTPPLTTMNLITSKERHIREPIWYLDSGCSRSMTGVMSYLHKYVEKPGPKVVFGDNSYCITEGYGSINCGGVIFTKVVFVNGLKYNLISISQLCDAKYIVQFDDKQGTIFNANKEIVLIAPRRNDVYVLNISSLTLNGACFFAKASESISCLRHKRLSHLNFKNINKFAKQNKVLGLPSLVYSKDKPC